MRVFSFTFNPFSENTYIVASAQGSCWIIDPGMTDESEDVVLLETIEEHRLKPVAIINTHCHIDHVLGNAPLQDAFNIPIFAHPLEKPVLERAPAASLMWDVPYRLSPEPEYILDSKTKLSLDELDFEVRFAPGHAPGHVILVNHANKFVFVGDVIFKESVGRVDLPGGNGPLLAQSIQQQVYSLPDEYTLAPGHGPSTTVAWEKRHNPFVRTDFSAF